MLDASTADRSGYFIGEQVHIVTSSTRAVTNPRLVGIADFQQGGSLNGATLALFDTRTAQDLFLDGRNAFTDVWVTAADGVSQAELRDQAATRLPDGVEALTGDDAADESASELLKQISFLTTFLLIFAGIALVVGAFLIVNTFSILVAQRSRELALLRALGASKRQVTWSVLLEAFVLGVLGSTIGLGLGVLLAMGIRVAVRPVRAGPVRPAADLRAAHGAGGVRRRRGRHDDRGLAAGPAYVADRAGPGAARRHRDAGDLAAPAAAARVSCSSSADSARSTWACSPRCRTAAGSPAAGCWRSCSASPRRAR